MWNICSRCSMCFRCVARTVARSSKNSTQQRPKPRKKNVFIQYGNKFGFGCHRKKSEQPGDMKPHTMFTPLLKCFQVFVVDFSPSSPSQTSWFSRQHYSHSPAAEKKSSPSGDKSKKLDKKKKVNLSIEIKRLCIGLRRDNELDLLTLCLSYTATTVSRYSELVQKTLFPPQTFTDNFTEKNEENFHTFTEADSTSTFIRNRKNSAEISFNEQWKFSFFCCFNS